jgi:hypothetical protein
MKMEIEQLVANCDGTEKSIQATVNTLLTEETVISAGDTVAFFDDDVTMGMVGKGRVKSLSDNKQYANVELDNGTTIPMQTNLLFVVGK